MSTKVPRKRLLCSGFDVLIEVRLEKVKYYIDNFSYIKFIFFWIASGTGYFKVHKHGEGGVYGHRFCPSVVTGLTRKHSRQFKKKLDCPARLTPPTGSRNTRKGRQRYGLSGRTTGQPGLGLDCFGNSERTPIGARYFSRCNKTTRIN